MDISKLYSKTQVLIKKERILLKLLILSFLLQKDFLRKIYMPGKYSLLIYLKNFFLFNFLITLFDKLTMNLSKIIALILLNK